MSDALERQVIAQVLDTYARANGIPVEWPNRTFTVPSSGPYVTFNLLDTVSRQIELGSPGTNTDRTYGSLILQIFVPADSGDGAALMLADTLGALYRQQVLNFPDSPPSGHVRMRTPVTKKVGRDGAFFQYNLIIPFHRDSLP